MRSNDMRDRWLEEFKGNKDRKEDQVDRPLEIICLGLVIGMVVYMFYVGTA